VRACPGALDLFLARPGGLDTAVFAACVSIGIVWTVLPARASGSSQNDRSERGRRHCVRRLPPGRRTVLRTPTLIWMFVGGALVTFAVNG